MLTRNKKRKMTKRKRVMKRGGMYPRQSVSQLNVGPEFILDPNPLEKIISAENKLAEYIASLEIQKTKNPFNKFKKTRKLKKLKKKWNDLYKKNPELREHNMQLSTSAEFPSSESVKSFKPNPLVQKASSQKSSPYGFGTPTEAKTSSQKSSSSGRYGFGTPTEAKKSRRRISPLRIADIPTPTE